MKLLTLRDNLEYSETFKSEANEEIYKKILEMFDEEEDFHSSLSLLGYINPSYINTFSHINEFIEFLYNFCIPITNFESLKKRVKKYIEEKLEYNIIPFDMLTNLDYIFYSKNKISMEGFYQKYHKQTVVNIKKTTFEEENENLFIEINWSKEFREAESIVFNNKTYTFGLFYEKKQVEGSLHFWRLNEENKWERLSLDNYRYGYDLELLDPEYEVERFYIWTATDPGDITADSTGPLQYYTFV